LVSPDVDLTGRRVDLGAQFGGDPPVGEAPPHLRRTNADLRPLIPSRICLAEGLLRDLPRSSALWVFGTGSHHQLALGRVNAARREPIWLAIVTRFYMLARERGCKRVGQRRTLQRSRKSRPVGGRSSGCLEAFFQGIAWGPLVDVVVLGGQRDVVNPDYYYGRMSGTTVQCRGRPGEIRS